MVSGPTCRITQLVRPDSAPEISEVRVFAFGEPFCGIRVEAA